MCVCDLFACVIVNGGPWRTISFKGFLYVCMHVCMSVYERTRKRSRDRGTECRQKGRAHGATDRQAGRDLRQTEILTDHSSVKVFPAIIAHCPPHSFDLYFHPACCGVTVYQSHILHHYLLTCNNKRFCR